jgi:precorrin-6x reductase
MSSFRVLILGGTSEASALTALLAGDEKFAPILSLAGVTKTPVLPAGLADAAKRRGGGRRR